MGYLMNLHKDIKKIDSIISFYKVLTLSTSSRLNELESVVQSEYKDKSLNIEAELQEKLQKEKAKLEDDLNNQINNLRLVLESNQSEINSRKKEILDKIELAIQSETINLDKLLNQKENIINKVKSFNLGSEIKASFLKSDIPNFNSETIEEITSEALSLTGDLMSIELDDISLNSISEESLFPVLKLENQVHPDLETTLRFLNIIVIFGLVFLYSNVITVGILGGISYLGVKNYKKVKNIRQLKDYILTVLEYSEDMRDSIRRRCENQFRSSLVRLDTEISNLTSKYENELMGFKNNTSNRKQDLEQSYVIEKDNKIKEVKSELQLALSTLRNILHDCQTELNNLNSIFNDSLSSLREELQLEFDELNRFELDILNDNLVLNLKRFHLGHELNSDSEINYFEDLPFSSLLFVYSEDKVKMRNLMKYITCQFSSKLKGNLLSVNILDPVEYGEGLSELVYENNIGQFYNNDEVNEKVKLITEKFTRDVKNIFTGYSSIEEYNAEKVSKGSNPYPLTLNIIQNVNIFTDITKYKQMLQTSKNGVINLILVSNELIEEVSKEVKSSEVRNLEFLDFLDLFGRIYTCGTGRVVESGNLDLEGEEKLKHESKLANLCSEYVEGATQLLKPVNNEFCAPRDMEIIKFDEFKDIEEGTNGKALTSKKFEELMVTPKEFREYAKKIHENIFNAKSKVFLFKDFMNDILKRSGRFGFDNTKGLQLPLGYKDGDVEKPFTTPLDDLIIHYYIAGRTGMGKSNTINNMLNTLVNMYTPDQVEIYYIDFKVIEGKKYMRNPTPHFKCISVSADPYYLISLYRHLEEVLRYRQSTLLPQYNAGKVEDIRKQGVQVPAIVVIVDEVGEGFKNDPDIVKEIIDIGDSLSRLGRASDFHLIYTSQDVSDKIPDGMLNQFSGRIALPVSTGSESKRVVKNESASDPEFQSKGDLLININNGDIKGNVRVKVPLIEPWDMDENLEEINTDLAGKYEMNCVLFDESVEIGVEELDNYLDPSNSALLESTVILGGNAQFAVEDYPVGATIDAENGNNVFILSQGKKRRIELTNTVMKNFAKKNGQNCILLTLRGNKDYASFDYIKEYDGMFNTIIEFETLDALMEELQYTKMYSVEQELKGHTINEIEGTGMFHDDFCNEIEDFKDFWEGLKEECERLRIEKLNKNLVSCFMEFIRPYCKQVLVLVEGVDELEGIGVNGYGIKEHYPMLNYSPYYNIFNIWTSAIEPVQFSKVEPAFKHRLVGSLDPGDWSKYKFMKDSIAHYGGYKNILKPSGDFKFKIFRMNNIKDDELVDNKVKINKIN